MQLTSPDFESQGLIPPAFTCEGLDISPSLIIQEVPENTQSLVVMMTDPDSPRGTWVHWLVWNIPAYITRLRSSSLPAGAIEGINTWGKNEYGGPCPGSGQHHYVFTVFAVDVNLELENSVGRKELEEAMADHILDQAELVGVYQRSA